MAKTKIQKMANKVDEFTEFVKKDEEYVKLQIELIQKADAEKEIYDEILKKVYDRFDNLYFSFFTPKEKRMYGFK